jgi:hypothetical protein
VNINDLDEAPAIAPGSFAVSENAVNATPVGIVPVTQPDANDTYTYSITGGDPGGAFAIDNSGNITVADGSQLYYSNQPTYTLSVQVADDDGNLDTATINVDLVLGLVQPEIEEEVEEEVEVETDSGDDLLEDPEPDAEPDPELQDEQLAEGPPSGTFEGFAGPQVLSTSSVSSLELDAEVAGGGIVYQDPDAETQAEQGGYGDATRITLTTAQSRLLESERIAATLDQIRTEMTDSAHEAESEREVVVSAAQSTMIAASLGWLALLMRGGSLAALAFSSLPLWRGIDPLAILALSDEERDRLEEELKKSEESEDEEDEAVGDLLDRR